MSKQTETLKLALEALEEINKLSIGENAICLPAEIDTAMDAIREALAEQPAQQEPVAVVSGYYGGQCVILPIDPARIFNSGTALYTSPPANANAGKPWGGLTDEEKRQIFEREDYQGWLDYINAIEAKLKEKNA